MTNATGEATINQNHGEPLKMCLFYYNYINYINFEKVFSKNLNYNVDPMPVDHVRVNLIV